MSIPAIEKVLVGLGLTEKGPQIGTPEDGESYEVVIDFLKTSAPEELAEMILLLQSPTNHAILPRKAHPEHLEVMDPEATDFSHIRWDDLQARMPNVLRLKRSRNR